ncbi:lanC-like protein GCR2 [Actinidia eriantha]|uniref:lanC-like protein GCR2 n=1 Tax=Actinidia eriantha TaxID=165200 RepID=UPI0025902E7D|nr:lanC-like protein GCR2 [Actinidia eriantha]
MKLKPDEVEDVKGTLRYMIQNFPSGNYPSSEGSESDRLVHWCHGASGVALTLVKAAEGKWYWTVDCLKEWGFVTASARTPTSFLPSTD